MKEQKTVIILYYFSMFKTDYLPENVTVVSYRLIDRENDIKAKSVEYKTLVDALILDTAFKVATLIWMYKTTYCVPVTEKSMLCHVLPIFCNIIHHRAKVLWRNRNVSVSMPLLV